MVKRKAASSQGEPAPKKALGMKLTFRKSAPIVPKAESAEDDSVAKEAADIAAAEPTPRAMYVEEPEMEWAPGGDDVTRDFTPGQLRRYEKFRRSTFSRAKLKQLITDTTGGSKSCNDRVAVTVQYVPFF